MKSIGGTVSREVVTPFPVIWSCPSECPWIPPCSSGARRIPNPGLRPWRSPLPTEIDSGSGEKWIGSTWMPKAIMSFTTINRDRRRGRSEEHTSELQSRENIVCRLLLEKKKHRISYKRLRPKTFRAGSTYADHN